MCTKAPATVDYETNNRGGYLNELDSCLKRFNGALAMTHNSFRDLLSAFDHMAQVFGNLGGGLSPEVRDPVLATRDGLRDLKDKGPFVAFNSDVHEGTMNVLEPLRAELKKAQQALNDLKSKQKDYDSLRFAVEKTEREHAKKDKPLTNSKSYKKEVDKRNKSKLVYEQKREGFEDQIAGLKARSGEVVLKSMNNYLHCTASLTGYLETTLNSFRTDIDVDGNSANTREIKLDRMKVEAERQSVSRRQQLADHNSTSEMNNISLNNVTTSDPNTIPQTYPTEDGDHNTVAKHEEGEATEGGNDFGDEGGEGMYPADVTLKNPLLSA